MPRPCPIGYCRSRCTFSGSSCGAALTLVFSVLGRAVFASIAYATKRLTDTVLAMHDPATEASTLLGPFMLFVALVVARFVIDSGMWFSSYHTRSPMLVRIKEEVFAYAQRLSAPISRTRCLERLRIGRFCYPTRCSRSST